MWFLSVGSPACVPPAPTHCWRSPQVTRRARAAAFPWGPRDPGRLCFHSWWESASGALRSLWLSPFPRVAVTLRGDNSLTLPDLASEGEGALLGAQCLVLGARYLVPGATGRWQLSGS